MEKAFGYVRVFTENNRKDDHREEDQKIAIKEYCRKNKTDLIEIFSDREVSGLTVAREGLSSLLSSIHGIDKVIVVNTSRLWSSNIVKVLIERQLKKLEVELISLEEPTYSMYNKGLNDLETKNLIELLDQYDKMNLALKLSKGRKDKAKGGIKGCGEAPLGYRWRHERLDKPVVVIEPEKAELVKLIFSKYLELGSIGEVKEYLDIAGHKTNRGKSFCAMGIRHILTNEFYIGELTWGKMAITGQHEPIINKATFYQVQGQLNRNRRNCK